MYFREKVEEIILNRLLATAPINQVSDDDFQRLLSKLQPKLLHYSNSYKIIGFTNEDLYSFLVMKVHQIMRDGLYDLQTNDSRFFNRVFNNFLIDIYRLTRRHYFQNKYDKDWIDECIWVDEIAKKIAY